jgi:hypothetical protein
MSRINASPHGTRGEVVAVEDGQVVWAGPLHDIEEARTFDALFCHEEDEEELIAVLRSALRGFCR